MTDPIDRDQRLAALDVSRSICVTAPAGSGKTELLTQRMLSLLSTVDHPEQILAVTFTKKAAAEMRERLVGALRMARDDVRPEESHKQLSWDLARRVLERDESLAWHLMHQSQRLRIQTIDSLCLEITRDQPVVSEFGATPTPDDQPVLLYDAAVSSLLEVLDKGESEIAADIVDVLRYLDNNLSQLRRLLVAMLASRDQWLGIVSQFENSEEAQRKLADYLACWMNEHLEHLRAALLPYAGELVPLVDFAASHLAESEVNEKNKSLRDLKGISSLPDASLDALQQWEGLAQILLTVSGTYRKKVTKNEGFPSPSEVRDTEEKAVYKQKKQEFTALIGTLSLDKELLSKWQTFRALPTKGYMDTDWRLLPALTRCLVHACAHLRLIFSRYGRCDYSEILLVAARILKQGSEYFSAGTFSSAVLTADQAQSVAVKNRWDASLRHILVDEFQDTSLQQYELLEALTSEWADDNKAGTGNPRTVFLVGDGMQSIYAFRAAKVGLFIHAQENGFSGLPMDALTLRQNFRSTSAIVEWNNQLFSHVFPKKIDIGRGAVPYYSSLSTTENKESEIHCLAAIDDSDGVQEAHLVACIVQKERKRDENASIAILVRSRSHLEHILPLLSQHNIPWAGVDLQALLDYPAVDDALMLTKALSNPADQLAWCALLRSPWCGLTLPDLTVLFQNINTQLLGYLLTTRFDDTDKKQLLDGLSDDGFYRLNRFINIVSLVWKEKDAKPFRHWIEGAWRAIGGAGGLSKEELAAVGDYFDCLDAHVLSQAGNAHFFSIDIFENSLSGKYLKTLRSGASAGIVQVMTIHKAKGLEFDVVVLPGLSRRLVNSERPILYWNQHLFDNGDTGLVLAPMQGHTHEAKNNMGKNGLAGFLSHESKSAEALEQTRLLYVAATRAKKQLYLTAALQKNDKDKFKPPVANSALASIWDVIGEQFLSEAKEPLFSDTASDINNTDLPKRIASSNTPRNLLRRYVVGTEAVIPAVECSGSERTFQDDSNIVPSLGSATAIAVGVCIHEVLELLICLPELPSFTALKSRALDGWKQRLIELSVPLADIDSAVQQVISSVEKVMASETGRWLLSKHQESKGEWRLIDNRGDIVEQIVIDRSFVVDGERWVIDYKTATPAIDDESLESFLSQQRKQYMPQLERYYRVLSSVDSRPIRLALYFTAVDVFEELKLPQSAMS